jgi:hypothetical protein
LRFLAYIDPGTGSFIFQAVIGAAVGAVFAARRWIGSLLGRFKKGKKKDSDRNDNK